jgi:hypothetical protein
MQSRAERSQPIALRAFLLVVVALGAHSARAQEVLDDGRVGVIFAHPIAGDVSGAPYLWFDDQTGGVKTYRVSVPDVIYHARPWLQGLGGFIVNWTDGQPSGNTRELRPYLGVKIFVPNSAHIHVYDLTRYEWRRITNTARDTITREGRFRTRPGVEFPLSARPWKPGTFYGLSNGELFVEHSFVNALRFMSGSGYIKNDRLRIEFQYVLELSRKASTDRLAYSDNSFRLDFKFSFKQGLLLRQDGPE